MASIISAGTTSGTAINISGDTTGNLAFTTQAGANTITVPNVTGTMLTSGSPQSGGVIQVVQATYATQTTTTSTSYVTTGLSASITPKFATSKILVTVSNTVRAASGGDCNWTVFRGTVAGTNLAGAGYFVYGTATGGSTTVVSGISINYLDSPATTSATTYTLGFKSSGVSVNSQHADATATITLLEIAA